MTMKAVCTHTDGRMPRIERYTSTPMMAAATTQVTGFENVCVGNSTNSRYAPARVMLPTLANVETGRDEEHREAGHQHGERRNVPGERRPAPPPHATSSDQQG